MKMYLLTILCVCQPIALCAAEYIYPIASIDSNKVLVMYQPSHTNTQLWLWHAKENRYEKLLSSQYNPVGVRLLPDNSGFSFIDNGIIKIKRFNKRSPKSIEIYEPIHDISLINWIDADTCYFHAKRDNRYGIYQLTIDGELEAIIVDKKADCLYPQKVGDALFYIERDAQQNHRIIRSNYIVGLGQAEVKSKNCISDFGTEQIAFLSMSNEREGFVVGYPRTIEIEAATINFRFSRLFEKDGCWQRDYLFLFDIPTTMVFDNKVALCETILPLLPRKFIDGIYFTSLQQNGFLGLFYCNRHDRSITPRSRVRFFDWPTENFSVGEVHCFAPMWVDGFLTSGSSR